MDSLRKSYYTYILYSKKSDLYYVGSTDNYKRRLLEHNADFNHRYTGKHCPWELKWVLQCGTDRKTAIKVERFIKKQKSRKFIERIIAGEQLIGEFKVLVRVPVDRD